LRSGRIESGFDTNRAELKPESLAAIQEVAKLLKGDSALKLLVVGVGMAAPVATNETDEGRAKNRRVELVKQ